MPVRRLVDAREDELVLRQHRVDVALTAAAAGANDVAAVDVRVGRASASDRSGRPGWSSARCRLFVENPNRAIHLFDIRFTAEISKPGYC